jgi:peptide/nickel transport system permease protein
MYRYIIRRLIAMPLLLLGVVTVAFIISHATHADPLASVIGDRAAENPEVIAAAQKRWGLDRSLPEQYLIYIGNLVKAISGISFRTKRPVLTDIAERLPDPGAGGGRDDPGHADGGGPRRAGRCPARPAGRSRRPALRTAGLLDPVFWSGLILLFIFTVKVHWLPGPGRLDSMPWRRRCDRLPHHRHAAGRRLFRASPMRSGIWRCRPSSWAGR